MKRFGRSNYSPQSRRALELLNDPKWSWNKFPRRQINIVNYFLRHPYRSTRLHFYNFMDWISDRIYN